MTEQPIDPELWRMTLRAARAADFAADDYLQQGGTRPRVEKRASIDEFQGGWINLSRPVFGSAPKDAPTDYNGLFASKPSLLRPIAFTDVTELVELREYILGRSDLAVRLGAEEIAADHAKEFIDYEIFELPISVLSRAHATAESLSDETLLSIYLERERSWLLDPLPVEYVIPLVLTALELERPLVVSDTIRIEPLDEPSQLARAPHPISVENVPNPVIGAATHAIVLSGHHIPNPGPVRRVWVRRDDGEPPLGDAEDICEVIRLLTPADLGYAQVLLRPIGWADRWTYNLPQLTTVTTVHRYPEWFDNFGWLREKEPILSADLEQVPAVFAALQGAVPRVRLAARRLSAAELRHSREDRVVDACIGLEALLSSETDELSHRMGLRAATALATRPGGAKPHNVYSMMRKVYGYRSKIVHGDSPKSETITLGDRTFELADLAVFLLRELLKDVVIRPKAWTPKSLDDDLLSALTPADELK